VCVFVTVLKKRKKLHLSTRQENYGASFISQSVFVSRVAFAGTRDQKLEKVGVVSGS
jgi:hypothetical protein